MSQVQLPIDQGYLTHAPICDTHRYATNWMAVLTPNPNDPNKPSRTFVPADKSSFTCYWVGNLQRRDVVEFGTNRYQYISSSGQKGPFKRGTRWYGVVVDVNDQVMTVVHCPTFHQAFQMASGLRF